jgi:hypothetical protein
MLLMKITLNWKVRFGPWFAIALSPTWICRTWWLIVFVLLLGACGGELACSTCHLIFDQATFDSLPPMTEEEQDMLDLAFEVTETSRLGCQVIVTEAFDGIKVRAPCASLGTQTRKLFVCVLSHGKMRLTD